MHERTQPVIRPCRDDETDAVLAVINAAAQAYRGVIPADRWREPYMPASELRSELASGVAFVACAQHVPFSSGRGRRRRGRWR